MTYAIEEERCVNSEYKIYRMAGNFGGKIFWRIAGIMTFGGIYFGD